MIKEENQIEQKIPLRKLSWQRFKKNRPAFISFFILCFLIFIAFFSSLIATDQPLSVTYKGKTFHPAFSQHPFIKYVFGYDSKDSIQDPKTGKWEVLQYDVIDWRSMPVDDISMSIVPYSPHKADMFSRDFVSPGEEQYMRNHEGNMVVSEGKYRHRWGTDAIGRDVLSGMIHGTKISLLVGIVAMGIAAIIGICFGIFAGYYGDHKLKISRLQLVLLFPGLFFGYFYGIVVQGANVSLAFHESILSGFIQLLFSLFLLIIFPVLFTLPFKKLKSGFLGYQYDFPLDTLISRFMEIFNSLPRLLLIISFSAIIEERSLWLVMVIIGVTSWTDIARFMRAEILRIRELDYITAAKSLGFSDIRIILKHALPNALAPVFVTIAFGISSAILIESGLSFLNIGVPADTVTWGSMLNTGRVEPEAWWMILYPGLAIFITVTVFNLIGDGLRDALDPRMKK